ncbi:MAG: hypothetical protein HC828_09030 [Blastochloris sp.]|nr:hypothetical protein [Blastochloris sp.]
MRTIIPFNSGWLYAPRDLGINAPDDEFISVTLPHTNIVLPWHNFDNAEYQFISTYRKRFTLPERVNGRRVYLDFDGAMIASDVIVNGHTIGTNEGGFTPFSFDITDALVERENVLTVRLDSTERPDITPYGFVVDYLTFWRHLPRCAPALCRACPHRECVRAAARCTHTAKRHRRCSPA